MPYTLTGRLTETRSGLACAGATLEIWCGTPDGGSFVGTVSTAGDGSFTLALPGGLPDHGGLSITLASERDELTTLTPREQEVLRLIAEGLSNREIADALYIAPRTASTHVGNILSKLGLSTRTAAATRALRRGLIREQPSRSLRIG